MNETAVRENIVVPLLRELGYRRDSSNHIIVEQPLRDARISLGRKKPSDPILRGVADYILEIDCRWRWVIEVKSAVEEITADARDQAWTYANHTEVRGIYFMVTNGRQFEIYRTHYGPQAEPIVKLSYDELRKRMPLLASILEPDSIKRDFPAIPLDSGLGLGPGLRSFAKVVNGTVTYVGSTPVLPGIAGMINHLREGSVERSNNLIIASIIMQAPQKQVNEMLEALGLDKFQIWTSDAVLSTDPRDPTVFAAPLDWIFPKGTRLPSIAAGKSVELAQELSFESITTATGILRENKFAGAVRVDYKMIGMPGLPAKFSLSVVGDFEMVLS